MSRVAEMRPLTDQQAAFVRHFILTGGRATEAAIAAGYSKDSAAQRAFELRQKKHVQQAIQDGLRKSFIDLAAIALDQARLMLLDPKTPASARVDLLKAVWDRGGLGVPKAGEDDGNEERPLRELSIAKLEALAVRAVFRPAEDAPAPVDAVVERLDPPTLQPADNEAKRG